MLPIAVNVAVLQENTILLTQRDDFETWILPGGGVEAGESLAQAAVRETREETGLEVKLTRLVGVYSRVGNFQHGHVVLFVGEPVGGKMRCQPGETIAVEWFHFDRLPSPLSVGHKRRIQDVVSGVGGGVCVTQDVNLPNYPDGMDRRGLYELRDRSGLSRQDFYLHLLGDASLEEKVDVGDV